jgi:hypothetical protein
MEKSNASTGRTSKSQTVLHEISDNCRPCNKNSTNIVLVPAHYSAIQLDLKEITRNELDG